MIGGPSLGGRAAKGRAMLDRIRRLASWARARAARRRALAQLLRADRRRPAGRRPHGHRDGLRASARQPPGLQARAHGSAAGGSRREPRASPRGDAPEGAPLSGLEGGDLSRRLRAGSRPCSRRPESSAGPDGVVVVARTPPSGALYHRSDNPLFVEALREVVRRAPTLGAWSSHGDRISARRRRPVPAERGRSRARGRRAVADARRATWSSGAGGTMTREAALLGVPTLSLFAGRTPAVDRWLEEQGRAATGEHDGRPAPDPAPLNRASRSRRATSAKRPAGGGVRRRPCSMRRGSRGRPPPRLTRMASRASAHARDDSREAIELARRLARWGDERGWRGHRSIRGPELDPPRRRGR